MKRKIFVGIQNTKDFWGHGEEQASLKWRNQSKISFFTNVPSPEN